MKSWFGVTIFDVDGTTLEIEALQEREFGIINNLRYGVIPIHFFYLARDTLYVYIVTPLNLPQSHPLHQPKPLLIIILHKSISVSLTHRLRAKLIFVSGFLIFAN